MAKIINVTVRMVPDPDREGTLNLLAAIGLKQLEDKRAELERGDHICRNATNDS